MCELGMILRHFAYSYQQQINRAISLKQKMQTVPRKYSLQIEANIFEKQR